jgi:hypothetical protein
MLRGVVGIYGCMKVRNIDVLKWKRREKRKQSGDIGTKSKEI